MKIISNKIPFNISCPRCFSKKLHFFGKDSSGYQKFRCKECLRQWAPDNPSVLEVSPKNYPKCPRCNKGSYLHHDYEFYSNFTCNDKRCNHHFKVPKFKQIPNTSSSEIELEQFTMKRMRHPFHIVITALTLYFLGNTTFRKISQHLLLVNGVSISHVTIHNWCKKFAPFLLNAANSYKKQLSLSKSDEWHFDETYIKINGINYYLWLALDYETRVIMDFHISEFRDSTASHTLLNSCKKQFGSPREMIITDRYNAYRRPTSLFFDSAQHVQVESFKDVISNNPIEAFNGQFKAWYKPKRGFNSFESANTLIALFIFFYNFIRPHSSLNNLTPAQVAGAEYSEEHRRNLLLIT